MICPNCGAQSESKDGFCEHCQAHLSGRSPYWNPVAQAQDYGRILRRASQADTPLVRAGYWLLAAALLVPGAVALSVMAGSGGLRENPLALGMTALYVAAGLGVVARLLRRR